MAALEIWVFFGKTELNDDGSWGSLLVRFGMAEVKLEVVRAGC